MIRLQLFGQAALAWPDGRELTNLLAQPKRFALLAYLATAPAATRHRRDTLLALFWPESDDEHARASLRQTLYELRRSLGRGVLHSEGKDLVAVNAEALWCDTTEFTALLERGCDEEALAHYRGPFLAGFHLAGAPDFERWQDGEQRRLQRLAVDAAWRLSTAAEADAPMDARKWAERALELAPYDEEGFRRYVELLARRRDLSTALRAYERFSRRLALELQTAPAPETAALVERLRQEPATVLVSKQPAADSVSDSVANPVQHGSLPSGDARAAADPVRPFTSFRARAVTGAVVLIAAIAVIAHLSARQGAPSASSKLRSILVLPLENLAADPEREFFSDGLTEALISELGQIRSLTVFSRATSVRLRDSPSRLSEIATRLGADGIIEGSAQQVGERVRVDLRLIDGPTEQLLWADTYEEDLRDVLDLQKRIARAVAHEVGVAISVEESELLSGGPPVQPAAYEEYLRGRYWFSKWTSDGFREATRSFQHAVYIDSTFAAAYAGLAYALLHVCYFGLPDAPPASSCHQRVESAALRALELDDQLAEAHLSLGFVRWWGHPRDRKASEEALVEALRLNPGHAEIHSRYAFLMSTLSRHEEAISAFERAYQLDPLAPDRAGFVAWELGVAGRFEEAEQAARRAIALEPEFANSHAWLGMTILAPQGRYEEAVASLRRALDLAGGHPMFRGMLGYVLGAAGRSAEAEAILEELLHGPGSDRVPPYYVALVYMGLGRANLALTWLEKANRQGWGHVIYLNVYHAWNPLRGHPRFERLLEDIGLPRTSMTEAKGAEDIAA